jgi:multiple sugar transport system ATP-binding protein
VARVELRGVGKSYDSRSRVVQGIDLEIADGEFAVFVGPSGCGKSTLLRMVAGLESITEGSVFIDGRCVNDEPPRHRDIAMVFQDYALYPHKTLYENMAFGLRLRKTPEVEIRRRVTEAARLLQIEALLERKPAALSGGQRQRVAIGRAIVRQPKVFLFDEPLSNLDAQLRVEMRTEIKKLHQRLGATIVYVTHDQVEAMTLADRICVLQGGRKIQHGSPEEVYDMPASHFVARFMGSPPMNVVPCALGDGCAVLGDVRIPLSDTLARVAAGRDRALFGIRPEDVLPVAGAQEAFSVPAAVVLTEPLGADTLVTLRVGGADLVGRWPPRFAAPAGAAVLAHLIPERMHLFDADSGAALTRP